VSALPEWPMNIPTDQEQRKGDQNTDDLFDTHRGNKNLVKDIPHSEGFKRSEKPRGPLRYFEED
jgi:hypothetical protein